MIIFKKAIIYFGIIVLSMLCFQEVFAEEQTTLTASPVQGTISGTNKGNQPNLDISFNLTGIGENIIINSVFLKFDATGSNSGYFKYVDKYSEKILASASPSMGANSIEISSEQFQKWLTYPEQNLGILIKGVDLGLNDLVNLSGIKMEIRYAIRDITQPVLMEMIISDLTTTSATFSLKSDESCTSYIDFGKTNIYTSTSAKESELKTNHAIILTGLEEGVTYHYRIILTDNSGNIYKSPDYTFLTKYIPTDVSGMEESLTLPIPSDLRLNIASDQGIPYAILTWKNLNSIAGIQGYIIFRSTDLNQNFIEIARVSDTELYNDKAVEPSKTYYYYIQSYSGSKISGASARLGILITEKYEKDDTVKTNENPDTKTSTLLFIFALVGTVVSIYYIILKIGKNFIQKITGVKDKEKIKKRPFDDIYKED